MKNKFLLLPVFLGACFFSCAQTLFTYGNHSVDAKEFLRAYKKAGSQPGQAKQASMRNYLDLYIASRLKIRDAYEKRLDTLASFKDEMESLRSQIIENYMNDPAAINKLVDEAFSRSQKDILVGHIFIPYSDVPSQLNAELRIREAHSEISRGVPFETVAQKYSADPAVQLNKGRIGYITVFSLPYEFENLVYGIAQGRISMPYKSTMGWHIFKNIAERKPAGRMKAAQILIAFPPGIDEAAREKLRRRADSIYQRLLKGDDFATMARTFSNDYISANAGGQMPEFGTGTYDPVFEDAAFALPSNGAISKPVTTSFGVHIIKRLSITPVSTARTKNTMDELRTKVEADPRISISRDLLYKRIIDMAGYKEASFNQQELFAYADSIIEFAPPRIPVKNLQEETVILKIGDMTKTAGNYIEYAINNRFTLPDRRIKPHTTIFEEFKRQSAFDYYRQHLEDYNADFRSQMNDFKEGNLFFEIMMQEVWSKAQSDTVGQKNYYERHRKKFAWTKSADAVVFYCTDRNTATQLHAAIKKNPGAWKEVQQLFADRSTVDSGRFELVNLPGIGKTIPRNGFITNLVQNKDDNSIAFTYVIKVYTAPAQKTFQEAKGDVITAYQNEIDEKWTAELRKKYPVKINEDVFRKISG